MELRSKIKAITEKKCFSWVVAAVLAVAMIISCTVVFIHNYCIAYADSSDGGWLPPSFGVIVRHINIATFFIVIAVVLKLLLKNRIKLWVLLIISILLPVLCYNLNYRLFKKDGAFYPLVQRKGALHFMVGSDVNYYTYYHELFVERSTDSTYGAHLDHELIDTVHTKVWGIGPNVGGHCDYHSLDSIIKLNLRKNDVEYTKIELKITFNDIKNGEKTSFYIQDDSGNKETINHTVDESGVVYIVFDAEACARWQANAKDNEFQVTIRYDIGN